MFGWGAQGAHIAEADLSAYADGAVSPRQAARIEAHTASCAQCASLLKEHQDMKAMVGMLPRATTQRSFALGPEYAAQKPLPPAPVRGFLGFAPALSLTVLVILLAVDLIPGLGSGDKASNASSSGGYATESTASKASGPPASPQPAILSAPAAPADNAQRPPIAPQPIAPGAAPNATPQAATARDAFATGTPTPGTAAGSALRPPPQGTGVVEGFNPQQPPQATPLVASKPPLQTTAASAHGSGVSLLRILEIVAFVAVVLSFGALVWDKKRR